MNNRLRKRLRKILHDLLAARAENFVRTVSSGAIRYGWTVVRDLYPAQGDVAEDLYLEVLSGISDALEDFLGVPELPPLLAPIQPRVDFLVAEGMETGDAVDQAEYEAEEMGAE